MGAILIQTTTGVTTSPGPHKVRDTYDCMAGPQNNLSSSVCVKAQGLSYLSQFSAIDVCPYGPGPDPPFSDPGPFSAPDLLCPYSLQQTSTAGLLHLIPAAPPAALAKHWSSSLSYLYRVFLSLYLKLLELLYSCFNLR